MIVAIPLREATIRELSGMIHACAFTDREKGAQDGLIVSGFRALSLSVVGDLGGVGLLSDREWLIYRQTGRGPRTEWATVQGFSGRSFFAR
jgi:hypothetical protein